MPETVTTPLPCHAQKLLHALVQGGWDLTCSRTPESPTSVTVAVTGNKGCRSLLVVWNVQHRNRYQMSTCEYSFGGEARPSKLGSLMRWLEAVPAGG